MTELEQARAHLCFAQSELYRIRTLPESYLTPVWIKYATGSVLAALSWVWDAQERAEKAFAEEIASRCGIGRKPAALAEVKQGMFLQHLSVGTIVSFSDGKLGRIVG
jgi:hypothetical protein